MSLLVGSLFVVGSKRNCRNTHPFWVVPILNGTQLPKWDVSRMAQAGQLGDWSVTRYPLADFGRNPNHVEQSPTLGDLFGAMFIWEVQG